MNKNIRLINKYIDQYLYFSSRSTYANKEIRNLYYSVVDTTNNSTEDMIKKVQSLTEKTKLKFYKGLSNYYDEINIRRQIKSFQFEEYPFSRNVQGIGKIYHEILLIMNFLQTKPKFKSMNINYYNLYYTVIKNRNENGAVNDKHENNEQDYIKFNDFIPPNHYIGRKKNKEILKWRKLRCHLNHFNKLILYKLKRKNE